MYKRVQGKKVSPKTLPVEEKSPSIAYGDFNTNNELLVMTLKSEKGPRVVLYDVKQGKRLWFRDVLEDAILFFEDDGTVFVAGKKQVLKLNPIDGSVLLELSLE